MAAWQYLLQVGLPHIGQQALGLASSSCQWRCTLPVEQLGGVPPSLQQQNNKSSMTLPPTATTKSVQYSHQQQQNQCATTNSNNKSCTQLPAATTEAVHCQDIHRGEFQQCHEPAGNSSGTKSTQGRSTRPLRKVTFDQSRPTMIRPDLNNFSA